MPNILVIYWDKSVNIAILVLVSLNDNCSQHLT